MTPFRLICYGGIVLLFALAGIADLCAGQWKYGCLALCFGPGNGIAFFWR